MIGLEVQQPQIGPEPHLASVEGMRQSPQTVQREMAQDAVPQGGPDRVAVGQAFQRREHDLDPGLAQLLEMRRPCGPIGGINRIGDEDRAQLGMVAALGNQRVGEGLTQGQEITACGAAPGVVEKLVGEDETARRADHGELRGKNRLFGMARAGYVVPGDVAEQLQIANGMQGAGKTAPRPADSVRVALRPACGHGSS